MRIIMRLIAAHAPDGGCGGAGGTELLGAVSDMPARVFCPGRPDSRDEAISVRQPDTLTAREGHGAAIL